MNRVQQLQANDESQMWPIFRKMLFFTFLMVVCPISAYFLSKAYVFEGKMSKKNILF